MRQLTVGSMFSENSFCSIDYFFYVSSEGIVNYCIVKTKIDALSFLKIYLVLNTFPGYYIG